MKKKLLIPLVAFSFSSFANVIDEINNKLNIISNTVNYEYRNLESLEKANKQLERVIYDLNNLSGDNGSTFGSLLCVARDNDGRAPYVLASKDPRTTRSTRIDQTTIKTLEMCEKVIAKKRTVARDMVAVCVSRDNDGASPWSIALLNQSGFKAKIGSFLDIDTCLESLKISVVNPYIISICSARDNDGRSPFSRFVFSLETSKVERFEVYTTIEECNRNNI